MEYYQVEMNLYKLGKLIARIPVQVVASSEEEARADADVASAVCAAIATDLNYQAFTVDHVEELSPDEERWEVSLESNPEEADLPSYYVEYL
jgi:hypothetical protein